MTDFLMDTEHPIIIPYDTIQLDGVLHIPSEVRGIVIFAHGSGSSRFSPRNQYIARVLQYSKFATLLFDLLTKEEEEVDEQTMEYRFDVEFLANRLLVATNWILSNPSLHTLPMGYFGASTGGGAALLASTKIKHLIKAVVSRGGRPDLAMNVLPEVHAATLLIVGGNDYPVIELNQKAYEHLRCVKKLEIVPDATHLFEEPGKLAEVATIADEWFKKYLRLPT